MIAVNTLYTCTASTTRSLGRYLLIMLKMADSMVYGSVALYLCISLLILDLACCKIGNNKSCLKTKENNCSFQDFSSIKVSSGDVEAISGSVEIHNLYSSNHSTCSSENGSDFCSPWHYCDNGVCSCGEVPHGILHCSKKGELSVLDSFCVTFNARQGLTEAGNCIFNAANHKGKDFSDNIYRILPKIPSELNEVMCGSEFNRNDTLCGRCKDGYFPQVYSFNMTCVKCPHSRVNWWKYVLSAFLPLTIFYIIAVFFKISNTSSHLHGFIYYCQAISMPQITRLIILSLRQHPKYLTAFRYVVSFYGIWNLDFFRTFDHGICLGTDTLQTFSLDIAVGIYPLLLMVVSYVLIDLYDRNFRLLVILWKPFLQIFSLFRRNWDIRTSVIDTFSTFFLLSNVKLLSVSFDLLVPVKVYQLSSSKDFNYTWRLYYDATVPYFGETHLPYAILAIAILFFFVLLPVLLLILYPCSCFHKLLNRFPFRWYILHTFVDSFHGCYKNGTEPGTLDCRWFASCFFIARFVLFSIGLATFSSIYFVIASAVIVIFVILLVIIEPFKADSSIEPIYVLFLSLFYVSVAGYDVTSFGKHGITWFFSVISLIVGVLPLLFVSVNIIVWLIDHWKLGLMQIRRIYAFRRRYELLDVE